MCSKALQPSFTAIYLFMFASQMYWEWFDWSIIICTVQKGYYTKVHLEKWACFFSHHQLLWQKELDWKEKNFIYEWF